MLPGPEEVWRIVVPAIAVPMRPALPPSSIPFTIYLPYLLISIAESCGLLFAFWVVGALTIRFGCYSPH